MKNTKPLKAVIYCRTATSYKEGTTPALVEQEIRCQTYAVKNQYEVEKVFFDKGVSGSLDNPGILAMLEFLHGAAEVHVVIINTFDRLSRDLSINAQMRQHIEHANGRLESVS